LSAIYRQNMPADFYAAGLVNDVPIPCPPSDPLIHRLSYCKKGKDGKYACFMQFAVTYEANTTEPKIIDLDVRTTDLVPLDQKEIAESYRNVLEEEKKHPPPPPLVLPVR